MVATHEGERGEGRRGKAANMDCIVHHNLSSIRSLLLECKIIYTFKGSTFLPQASITDKANACRHTVDV